MIDERSLTIDIYIYIYSIILKKSVCFKQNIVYFSENKAVKVLDYLYQNWLIIDLHLVFQSIFTFPISLFFLHDSKVKFDFHFSAILKSDFSSLGFVLGGLVCRQRL